MRYPKTKPYLKPVKYRLGPDGITRHAKPRGASVKKFLPVSFVAIIGIMLAYKINATTIDVPVSTDPIPHVSREYQFDPCGLSSVACGEKEAMQPKYRLVTAYNPVPEQTDASPCIAASGTDICAGMAAGGRYVATNELPIGSVVEINGETYTVVDRTNDRYTYRYDIAMPADQIDRAFAFGKQVLEVKTIK